VGFNRIFAAMSEKYRELRFRPYVKKKTVEGVDFWFYIGNLTGKDWYDTTCTDPDWPEMKFIRDNMVSPGDVVFECGSHHGCTATLLSTWVGTSGKVIAFEPSPDNAAIIRRNIELNGLRNIVLEQKAVGSRSAERVKFSRSSNGEVLTKTLSGGFFEVEVTDLDSYVHLGPALLKLDVQGYEVEVLKGASEVLKGAPRLAIEVHTKALGCKYGTSVEALLGLIGVERYDFWVQWDDSRVVVPFNASEKILKGCHLFAIPKKGKWTMKSCSSK
jgi:FkbM family methyltransferase